MMHAFGTSIFLDSLLKVSPLLLLAWLLTWRLRHAAASARHLVWVAAMVAVLGMPIFSRWLPGLPGVSAVSLSRMPEVGGRVVQRVEISWKRLFADDERVASDSAEPTKWLEAGEGEPVALGEAPEDTDTLILAESDALAALGLQNTRAATSPAAPAEPEVAPGGWQRLGTRAAGLWQQGLPFLPWIWLGARRFRFCRSCWAGGACFTFSGVRIGWRVCGRDYSKS